jgi:hypothetical protein
MSRAREVSKIVLTVENFDAVEYSSTPPANPKQGALWVDTSTVNPLIKAYNGDDWDTLGSAPVPIITGIAPSNISGSASTAIIVNGTNFESGSIVKLVDNQDNELHVLSTTFNNSQSLQFLTPTLTASAGPYDIKVTNTDNQFSIFENSLSLGRSPIWSTTAGSLGEIYDKSRSTKTFSVSAYDPDGGSVTYSIINGNLPTGMSISSGGLISGTAAAVASDTSYSFTLRATDESGSVSDRNFSITTKSPVVTIYNTPTSTNWTVPNGVTAIDFLVVGGGGGTGHTNYHNGGAGGGAVVYKQNHSVTPGQSHQIVVGAGGLAGTSPGSNADTGTAGGLSQFSSYQAYGGGPGGRYQNTAGVTGGCGGGGPANSSTGSAGGTNQPLYGDATVYRSSGGNGNGSGGGGGGGGAGGNGNAASGANGGNGGPGVAIDITGSTVYYGGGGGGSSYEGSSAGSGGIGGGGAGGRSNATPGIGGNGVDGLGGGAGGSERFVYASGAKGGCGTVIIRY